MLPCQNFNLAGRAWAGRYLQVGGLLVCYMFFLLFAELQGNLEAGRYKRVQTWMVNVPAMAFSIGNAVLLVRRSTDSVQTDTAVILGVVLSVGILLLALVNTWVYALHGAYKGEAWLAVTAPPQAPLAPLSGASSRARGRASCLANRGHLQLLQSVILFIVILVISAIHLFSYGGVKGLGLTDAYQSSAWAAAVWNMAGASVGITALPLALGVLGFILQGDLAPDNYKPLAVWVGGPLTAFNFGIWFYCTTWDSYYNAIITTHIPVLLLMIVLVLLAFVLLVSHAWMLPYSDATWLRPLADPYAWHAAPMKPAAAAAATTTAYSMPAPAGGAPGPTTSAMVAMGATPPRNVCSQCGADFADGAGLDAHRRATHERALPFKCPDCDAGFATQQELAQHGPLAHPKPYACDECDARFGMSGELGHHKAHAHPKHFKCGDCSLRFASAAELAAHALRSHPKPTCNECGDVFDSADALTQHQRTRHPKARCTQCGSLFPDAAHLDEHVRRVHPAYACPSCPKRFPTQAALDQHHDAAHSFRCAGCGQTLPSAAALAIHQAQAHPAHACPDCSQTFPSRAALAAHTAATHPKHRCPDCGAAFASADALTDHSMAAHPKHRCVECGSAFPDAATLARHAAVHERDWDGPEAIMKPRQSDASPADAVVTWAPPAGVAPTEIEYVVLCHRFVCALAHPHAHPCDCVTCVPV